MNDTHLYALSQDGFVIIPVIIKGMLIYQLFSTQPGLIIPWLTALIIGITMHEFSHGFAAYRLGDETALRAGRLTLNPLAHLDPLGAIMLFLVGFGWARPVPINTANLRRGNIGRAIVSVAGIFTNLLIAIISLIFLSILLYGNILPAANYAIRFLAFLAYINISLFVFNLIPIAPLDGYRIFESFAPAAFRSVAPVLEQWGFLILLALVFFTNIIGALISIGVGLLAYPFGIHLFELAFGGLY